MRRLFRITLNNHGYAWTLHRVEEIRQGWIRRTSNGGYDLLTWGGWHNVRLDIRDGAWARPWRFWWRDTLGRFALWGKK